MNEFQVQAWTKPIFEAFLAGLWLMHWTEDTLYWVAKPTVHVEKVNGQRRLHNESYAAVESDLENLYFWHGVLVPAFVVVKPEWITVKHIIEEENAEVRRVMFERMGTERFMAEAKMSVEHEDTMESQFPIIPETEEMEKGSRMIVSYRKGKEVARLLRCDAVSDGDGNPLKFAEVVCPSTGRKYHIRVKAECRRAYEAVASTFGMDEETYKSGSYARQGDVLILPLGKTKFESRHS